MRVQPLRVTSPAPRDVWQDVLESDPQALAFQAPTWLDCVCAASGGKDASRLYETADGQQLILPMARRTGPPWLTTQASFPPSWGTGGLLARRPLRPEDVAAVFDDLAGLPVLRTFLRPNPLLAQTWTAGRRPGVIAIPRRAHVLDLTGGFDQVWTKRFTGKTRTAIRKAEKAGLVVECDSTGKLVPVFYDLLSQSFDRWANQQHEPLALARWRGQRRDPLAKFQKIAEMQGNACRIWVAWLEGRPAATILVLRGTNVSYTRGAMNKELAAPTRANDLLQRLAIEEACRDGCRYYHMGESGDSAALADYKERFGAEAHEYAEYRLERLPITQVDKRLRGFVKRLIGFKDT